MKIVNVALQEREVDDDYAIFGTSDNSKMKCFVLSKELLQFLGDNIAKKLSLNNFCKEIK